MTADDPVPVVMRRWRVGSHYGIHVYETTKNEAGDYDSRPVATFHTVQDARDAVMAFNLLQHDLAYLETEDAF